ncbi:unnamed protein product [Caenorhabditis angaria]|uniref:Uncharacterized protein n=1 Tax=Caenorhabditis angaria TaxID=860376 RepID=A0A9P1IYR8_9PELO|nr:unnamed protein product [Caenorhabditis angaria]
MSVESLVFCVSRRIWRNDEDWSDRLHTTVTSNILIGLAGLVAAKSWNDSPIECIVPAMFSSSTATV